MFIYCILVSFVLAGCGNRHKSYENTLVVSIAPLKYIIETVTCGDFPVEVLVPEGVSPETYSPTPRQMSIAEKSPAIFVTGLIDFENELSSRLRKLLNNNTIIDLSKGIDLIEGTCSHNHRDRESGLHNHGTDPHVWTSPAQLIILARNAYRAIEAIYPDSLKYREAYVKLDMELKALDEEVASKISDSGIEYILVYHPALTYYARDYGIIQVALESEGKEPSAVHMRNIVSLAKDNGVKHILYQREFSGSAVKAAAKEIGASIVGINPLAENIPEEITRITNVITNVN